MPAPKKLIDAAALTDLATARGEASRRGDQAALRAITLGEQAAEVANSGNIERARQDLAAALCESGPRPDLRLLFLAFQFFFRIGDLGEAERLTRRRIEAADPESPDAARAHGNLGLVLHRRGDLDAAEESFDRAVEIDRRLGDEYGLARDLGNSAMVPESRGDLDGAEAIYGKALSIAERIGADEIVVTKLTNLGDVALQRGQREEARALWTRALTVIDRLGGAKWRDEVAEKLANLDGVG